MPTSCFPPVSFFTIVPIFLRLAMKEDSLPSYSPSRVGAIGSLSKDATSGFLTRHPILRLTSRTLWPVFPLTGRASRRII